MIFTIAKMSSALGTKVNCKVKNRRYFQNMFGPFELDYKSSDDFALFNIAIDSKLRGCDVVALKIEVVAPHG